MNQVDYQLIINGGKRVFHANILNTFEQTEETRHPEVACVIVAEDAGDINVPTYWLNKDLGVESVVISPGLHREEFEALKDVLRKYESVFSDFPGRTDVIEC